MLKALDVLIGLAVIMLALGMAVTLITQFVTTVLNTRGRNLRRGLATLLSQLDPALTDEVARTIAGAVLTHPLVATVSGRLGTVVHREEFTALAVTAERLNLWPDVPTMKESGVSVVYDQWRGFAAPKGTPPAVIEG